MTVMTEEHSLGAIAQLAAVIVSEANRDWNAVAEALGPFGTARLLALDAALAEAGIDIDTKW